MHGSLPSLLQRIRKTFLRACPRKKKRAEQSEEADETLLDKRLLATPSLAVENATDETVQTLAEAAHSLKDAVEGFLEQDGSRADSVRQLNAKVSESTQK